MKKKFLELIAILLVVTISSSLTIYHKTYSKYKKKIDVEVNTNTANLICDAEIDNPGTYISTDGWAYFKVIVKNYDANKKVSQSPIQYKVNVTNKDGSSAVFRYLDEGGYSNDTFVSDLTTKNYKFSADEAQDQEINIEVKTDSMASEKVDFKVSVDCYQSEK